MNNSLKDNVIFSIIIFCELVAFVLFIYFLFVKPFVINDISVRPEAPYKPLYQVPTIWTPCDCPCVDPMDLAEDEEMAVSSNERF